MGALILILLLYSKQSSERMVRTYAPLVDAAMEIKYETSIAHLWFEEVISGDTQEEITTVWKHLDQATWYATAMLEGGENSEGVFIPLDDLALRNEIFEAQEKLTSFRMIAEERFLAMDSAGIGSPIDQQFDRIFNDLLEQTDQVESELQRAMGEELLRFERIMNFIVLLSIAALGAVFFSFHRFQRQLTKNLYEAHLGQENLRITLNSIGDAVIATDDVGNITRMNPIAENLTGWATGEAEGKPLAKVFNIANAHTLEKAENPAEKVLQTGKVVGLANHTMLIAKDGSEYQIADSGAPIRDTGGKTTGVILVFRDVTEEYRMQEELQESEEKYRIFFENNDANILFINPANGEIIFANEAATTFYGYTKNKLTGMNVNKLNTLSPEEIRIKMADAQTRKQNYFVFKHKLANGEIRDVEVYQTKLRLNKQDVFSLIIHDITERIQAAEVLAAQRQRQANILQGTNAGTWDWNIQTGELVINERWAEIMGRTLDELKPINVETWSENSHPDDLSNAKALLEKHFRRELDDYDVVFRQAHKNGAWVWVHARGQVTEWDEDGEAMRMSGIHLDVTEQVQAEQAVQQYIQRLDALRKIDQSISSSFDLKVTLKVLLGHLREQLEIDAACVLLYEKDSLSFSFSQGQGFRTTALQHTNLRLGQGLSGKVALERHPIIIPDLAQAETVFAGSPEFEKENFQAYYGTPLVAKGELVGVLEVFHRSAFGLEKEWEDYLQVMAGQAAIAIDSITLFENLERSNLGLMQAYDATIEGWSRVLEARDIETEGHSRRVVKIAMNLAKRLNINEDDLLHIRRGALLHDIGKMGVPDAILRKPGKLTPKEWEIMRRHPVYAHEWLSKIEYLQPALDIPYLHHEKWEGTGYPHGLKGERIPIAARIFAIVDVWDALRSDRPYRKAWSREKTLAHIQAESGKHFDPQVVDAFMEQIQSE
ncbi:MAG: PAS domain S-box protein [Anaerolineae bacterium]|jgi:PAS domain S-box-containing protein|nr:PAS domain S-box protein [Anaerolineae bacterium]MBT6060752.1 PAS domain S-box protein [Anaerolineae bacterium]MBT7600179.1 PAS domain S-box protein [Anaerolineae bacterium]